jgi:penicillin-binding protein 1A
MPSHRGTRPTDSAPWRKGSPAPSRHRGKSKGRVKAAPARRRRGSGALALFKFLFGGAVLGAFALALVISYYAIGLPSTDSLFGVKGTPSVTVLDVEGKVIATRGAGVGSIVPVGEMPPYLPQAVMAIEDRRFYDHYGIDPWGLTRALFANMEAGRVVQGGSTITQQLAKNLFLTPERTFERKMEEAILALWLELKFSKDEILTLYLNRVYFGAGTYGVEAAARRYFNKSARDVTLKEAATLAGLLKAPSRFAPTTDADAAEERSQIVLGAMVDAHFITDKERGEAGESHPRVVVTRSSPGADYFADWVLEQVPGFIGGAPVADIVIETTLDLSMQKTAENAVAAALTESGEKLKVGQGAFVVLGTDGSVKAMVGGRSYAESQFNRAVQAKRPPGSSFKPFIFLAALEKGYTPSSMVTDAPIVLKKWSPANYKHKYEGQVTLTQALARSLNSVSVRLIMDVGPKNAVAVARRLGVLSNLRAQPALALGASEVNLLELTAAYASFANGGFSAMPHGIYKIRTREGQTLYERQGSGPMQVMAPVFAAEMAYMMRETVNKGTAKRAHLKDRDAAGKTGTGQGFRDAWFVGFTRDLVAGAWVGNDNNTAMVNVTGGSIPAEIWAAFMGAVADRNPAGPLIALERNPSMDTAAGEGWYENGVSEGSATEAPPVEGGFVADAGPVPTDGAPMALPEDPAFDRMFNEMFGEGGEIKGAVRPERRAEAKAE